MTWPGMDEFIAIGLQPGRVLSLTLNTPPEAEQLATAGQGRLYRDGAGRNYRDQGMETKTGIQLPCNAPDEQVD